MPSDNFNFDVRNSDLRIGIEVEYPAMSSDDEKYVHRGRDTSGLQSAFSLPSRISGHSTYDGTVGLEVVSDVLDLDDAPGWYADVIEYVEDEYNTQHQPTGLMDNGNTAGLHLHLSELSHDKARDLFNISQEPWAKVLFCSSIANSGGEASWPVFRGGSYCRMNRGQFNDRYNCVNDRGRGHYEWRMPEPMAPEHLEVVVRFLSLFEQDTELAIQYAQEVLDDGDDRITAIKRAEATGMDIDAVPSVRREMAEGDPENFYEVVEDAWGMPEIYTVSLNDDEFYLLRSELRGEFSACGVTFEGNDVLRAGTLERVQSEALRDDVERAFQQRNSGNPRQTEATEELKKIVKKKKGKL